MFEAMKGAFGVDGGTLLNVMVGVLGIGIPFVVSLCKALNYGFEKKYWKVRQESDGDFFYVKISCFAFIDAFIVCLLFLVEKQQSYSLGIILWIVCLIVSLLILNRKKYVQRRVSQSNKKFYKVVLYLFINTPLVLWHSIFYLAMYDARYMSIIIFLIYLISLVGIIGLWFFKRSYVYYSTFPPVYLV